MKNFIFQTTRWASLVLVLFAVAAITGCSDDEETTTTPTELVEDGFYISGDATFFSGFDIQGTLSSTKNEVLQEERSELLEAFVALNGTGGFNIIQVAGTARTTWGPGADFADVTEGTTDEPKVTFQRGSLAETSDQFTVPGQGLYHVIIDTEVGKVVIVPVEYWGIIGGATPNGWSGDTRLESTGFSETSITFQATEIPLTIGDYKFRHSGGWKVEIDTTYDLGNGDKGIKANTNFGGSIDALEEGGDNISLSESGFYTITMTWTLGAGYTATLDKTGDLPSKDWSGIELGLVGDGLMNGGSPHNWNETILLNTPSASGAVYTYSFPDVQVRTAGGGFKIREGQTWDNTILGFNEVTMAGDGAAEFETNGDGNFVPTVDMATYDIELVIDAQTEVFTFTVTKK